MDHLPHLRQTGTYASYAIGFALSLVLTLVPFFVISNEFLPEQSILIILVAAIIQLFVQLVFFLHVGKSSHTEWNLTALLFAILVVCILVIGTLWIMNNLNDRMTPAEIEAYLHKQN